jgi:hypothetical protein
MQEAETHLDIARFTQYLWAALAGHLSQSHMELFELTEVK